MTCAYSTRASQPPVNPLQRHSPSECCLDAATATRGRRVQRAIRIPDSRSRQHLCEPSRRVDPPTGDQGTEVTAAQSQNHRDLRARDRYDPQGMFGLADPPVRSPSALHAQVLDRSLQWRPPGGCTSGHGIIQELGVAEVEGGHARNRTHRARWGAGTYPTDGVGS